MDYSKILQQLQEYYANTLIVQYNNKPKAKATIEELTKLLYANMILLQIRDAFDWETAVGKQLDIIGQWVGVSRSYNIPSMSGRVLFSYPETSKLIPDDITTTEQFGYSDYSTFDTLEGGILRYDDLKGIDSQLNDYDYRVVIGLKIIYNSINHTAGEIDNSIWEYFNHTIYTTWSPHILTYNVPAEYMNLMQICLHKGVLPAPIGTEILLTQI